MGQLIASPPLYEKLKDELRDYIGRERPRLLPGENELVTHYGVSRNTVRRALRDLTTEGLLRPVQGLGTLVNYDQPPEKRRYILVLADSRFDSAAHEAFSTLMRVLQDYRLNALLSLVEESSVDEANLRYLLHKSEGVILDQSLSASDRLHGLISGSGTPMVCLRCWESRFADDNFVIEDVAEGFYLLARHLLEAGHREIAILCHPGDGLRLPGIRRAMAEFGMEPDPALLVPIEVGRRPEGYRAADALLRRNRRFTAIIGHNDASALGIMERLFRAGLRVPEDVALTGADSLAEAAEFPVPLTTFGGDLQAMINECISILLAGPRAKPRRKLFPVRLTFRESTSTAIR